MNWNNRIVLLLSVILFISISVVDWNNSQHITITKNIFTGEMNMTGPGLHISPPWVFTRKIDTRPKRFCIQCDCRVLNCRLVGFNPSGWDEFINREGFRFFWFSNRLSINSHNETFRGMDNILFGYAFSEENLKFIRHDD